jgi:phosphoribosylanthranilate isomerase
MRTRVKICCISSLAEASVAIAHGADALGLVAKMPSGPGVIMDEQILEIASTIPPPIASFLLTSEQSVGEIIAHVRRVQTNTVQIVDELQTRGIPRNPSGTSLLAIGPGDPCDGR